jgi:hypothetical protein
LISVPCVQLIGQALPSHYAYIYALQAKTALKVKYLPCSKINIKLYRPREMKFQMFIAFL